MKIKLRNFLLFSTAVFLTQAITISLIIFADDIVRQLSKIGVINSIIENTPLLPILFFMLIIALIVFVHEFGHFAAAKLFGIPVHQFAIGFGPKLLDVKYGETNYQVRALPLGGFVELEGEQNTKSEKGFRNRPFHQKAVVLCAGVFMNVVTAIVFLAVNLAIQNHLISLPKIASYNFSAVDTQIEAVAIRIIEVEKGGNSDGQLFEDDVIIGIDGVRFQKESDFKDLLKQNQNKAVSFEFLSMDDFSTSFRDVKLKSASDNGSILNATYYSPGDGFLDKPVYYIKYKSNAVAPFVQAWDITLYQIKSIGQILKESFQEGEYEEAAKVVGGPVALGDSINSIVDYEIYEALIFLTALINLSLAIVNILPIPALDGGQLAIAFIERVRKKQLSDELLAKINFVGFVFMMLLFVLMTLKDTFQFNIVGGIADYLKSALGK